MILMFLSWTRVKQKAGISYTITGTLADHTYTMCDLHKAEPCIQCGTHGNYIIGTYAHHERRIPDLYIDRRPVSYSSLQLRQDRPVDSFGIIHHYN
jgi:hypothetical protein